MKIMQKEAKIYYKSFHTRPNPLIQNLGAIAFSGDPSRRERYGDLLDNRL